jgi:hypothetical protein
MALVATVGHVVEIKAFLVALVIMLIVPYRWRFKKANGVLICK